MEACTGRRPEKTQKNRKKSITIGFRVTPREKDELYKRIELSGRSIQDYMLQSALCQKVVVVGNPRMRDAIIDRLNELEPLLERIASGENIDMAIMEELRTIYEITETWE